MQTFHHLATSKHANLSLKNNQKGFTLVETLLALIITGILYSISMPSLVKLYDFIKLNQFISVLQSDLHYIREYNMLPIKGDKLTLQIYHKHNYYVILDNSSTVKERRDFPYQVTIPSTSSSTTDITFNNLGHVSSGKTLTIKSHYFKKNVVFSIGTGGIDIRDSD